MANAKFCTALAPGCHGGRGAGPIVSRHRTLEAAIRRAKRNDRLAVYALEKDRLGEYPYGECLFILPMQNDPVLGAGRHGNGGKHGGDDG